LLALDSSTWYQREVGSAVKERGRKETFRGQGINLTKIKEQDLEAVYIIKSTTKGLKDSSQRMKHSWQ